MDENLVKLTGKPIRIIFRNEDTLYTVLRFQLNDATEKVIAVTGLFPRIKTDILYNLYGTYVEHPKYGMQFAMANYEQALPESEEGILRYLSGIQFQGIGKATAQKVVDVLGEDCIKKIKENPEILNTVGLTKKQIRSITEGLSKEDAGMDQLIRFLNVHGIGIRNLIRLNRRYGTDALEKIKENPYRVIEECDGFGFETADKIAMSLGFEKDDHRRMYAYLVSLTMQMCMRKGDSYVLISSLENEFLKKAECDEETFDVLLEEAVGKRSLYKEEDRIYSASQWDSEVTIAGFLKDYPYVKTEAYEEEELEEEFERIQQAEGIRYDEKQKEAVYSCFDHSFQIITGGPGTGKTTVVRAITALFQKMYPSAAILCAAPTGRAAKRLFEVTGAQATTIHSMLSWDLETNTFGKNEDEPIFADLLIVDEFSMVDAWLFSNLLKASKNVKKICIIGDEDQLPSVGPGSVLRDLIDSEQFPLIRLDTIYRQSEGSDVIRLAYDIRSGDVNLDDYRKDVAFLPCTDAMVKESVVRIVEDALSKNYSLSDIQVLSPMYNGGAGIDTLNRVMQDTFNPKSHEKREFRIGYTVFREGDKILQLKNQPEDDVYNGDVGILQEIVDAKESPDHHTLLLVDFHGSVVEYTQETWNNITLAYCISVHKAQGSEYPIVIMPFSRQHTIMLQRKLIYTAVTRASRSLVMLGNPESFMKGIAVVDRYPRCTTLCRRLKDAADIVSEVRTLDFDDITF